jgi:hypothetical protein
MPLRIGKRKMALAKTDTVVDEETTSSLIADDRNFFKVEVWSLDGQQVERMIRAGNSLDRAREVFVAFAKERPRAYVTVRQRGRVLYKSERARRIDDEQAGHA